MNKAVRLEPLKDYAEKVETEAARRLAATAKALTIKEKEVEQLRGYLAEYRQRAELDERTTDALRWQNTRAFLAKLSEVVAAREAELANAVEGYRLETETLARLASTRQVSRQDRGRRAARGSERGRDARATRARRAHAVEDDRAHVSRVARVVH